MSMPSSSISLAPRDFADWLSPMLVKELRQGMRTKVFVSSFILLQVLMTLNVVLGLASSSHGGNAQVASTAFWMMVGLPLSLILPLAGLNAVSGERTANTLELIFLTRLSAWRIVFGKWCAIVAQIVLFATSVLPYLVLRYFMGGVNLADDLLALAILVSGAAVMTAFTVGISPFQTKITRILTVLGVLFLLQVAVPFALMMILGPSVMRGAAPVGGWKDSVALGLFSIAAIALMLQIGAGKIAPSSENHAFIKRCMGMGIFLLTVVMILLGASVVPMLILGISCCAPVLIGAINEQVQKSRSIYEPFVRRGFAGRLLGKMLYPGWPSGGVYVLMLSLAFAGVAAWNKLFTEPRVVLIFISGVGTIFFAALITRLLFPKTKIPLGISIAVVAVSAMLVVVTTIFDNITSSKLHLYLCAVPPCGLIQTMFPVINDAKDFDACFPLVIGVSALSVVLFFLRSLPDWRRIGEIESKISHAADERVA